MASTKKQARSKTAGQSKYGRPTTGGKSIEVCNSYGVDVRPTALTEDNLRALAEEQLSPTDVPPDSPVKEYGGMWEYTVLPMSRPEPQVPYSAPPFTSPTPTPTTPSTASSSGSAGHITSQSCRKEMGGKTAAVYEGEEFDIIPSIEEADDIHHSTTGGKSITLMEQYGFLNITEANKYDLSTIDTDCIPTEIRKYLNENPELVLAYIKKALDNGNAVIPTATTENFPESVSGSEVEAASDRDFEPESEPESDCEFEPEPEPEPRPEAEPETETPHDTNADAASDSSEESWVEQAAQNYLDREQGHLPESPSPFLIELMWGKDGPPINYVDSTCKKEDEPVKQYAARGGRKLWVPMLDAPPIKFFLCPKASSTVKSVTEHARGTTTKYESNRAFGSLSKTLDKTTKSSTKQHQYGHSSSITKPADTKKHKLTKEDVKKQSDKPKSTSKPHQTTQKPAAKPKASAWSSAFKPTTSKPQRPKIKPSPSSSSSAKPAPIIPPKVVLGRKGSRPKNNSDLRPEFSPDLDRAMNFNHEELIPDQDLRLRVPYPAPSPILDASFDKYWTELAKANRKVLDNPNLKRPNIPWTVWEDDCVIQHMLDIRLDASVPETEARFKEAAKRLYDVHNVWRTETAIKNMWNRVGRARSGFDERKRQGEEMATSLQAGKKRKRTRYKGDSDDNDDSDLEEGEIRTMMKKKKARK